MSPFAPEYLGIVALGFYMYSFLEFNPLNISILSVFDIKNKYGADYILYLRGFSRDTCDTDLSNNEICEYNLLKSQCYKSPVIAVGNPRELFSPKGATRVYISGNCWFDSVEQLMESAKYIVILVNNSPNCMKEIIHSSKYFSKTTYIVDSVLLYDSIIKQLPSNILQEFPSVEDIGEIECLEIHKKIDTLRKAGDTDYEIAKFLVDNNIKVPSSPMVVFNNNTHKISKYDKQDPNVFKKIMDERFYFPTNYHILKHRIFYAFKQVPKIVSLFVLEYIVWISIMFIYNPKISMSNDTILFLLLFCIQTLIMLIVTDKGYEVVEYIKSTFSDQN